MHPTLLRRPWPAVALLLSALPAGADTAAPKSRTFTFTYSATVTGLKPGAKARVWIPVPSDSQEQTVHKRTFDLPGSPKLNGVEKRYGNRVAYTEARADAKGQVRLSATYEVTRREVRGRTGTRMKEDLARVERFLQADAKVPITGKPLKLLEDKELPDDPMKKARVLYDVVNGHMRYSKEGTGWGRGDAAWACDSKFGNCSDFHSLFISLARSQKLPSKFEIGFPLPPKRGQGVVGGYHCWAFFRPDGKGWVPVDISEANKEPKMRDYYFGNLAEDRVTFSTGRDIDLVPKQAGKPLNFFIYPHVEVDGKEHPQGKIEKRFTYKDAR